MAQVINIINTDIIAQVATDDGAVIEAYGHSQVMELQVIGFQFTDAYEAMKFAVTDQFRIKMVGDKNFVPVIRRIPVADEGLNFLCG